MQMTEHIKFFKFYFNSGEHIGPWNNLFYFINRAKFKIFFIVFSLLFRAEEEKEILETLLHKKNIQLDK